MATDGAKLFIIGSSGQMARALVDELHDTNHGQPFEIVTASRNSTKSSSAQFVSLDLNDLQSIEQTIKRMDPSLVINASAYTDVEHAEDDVDAADKINHVAVGEIGKAAAKLNIPVIHYSTDYVYAGLGQTPQAESDTTNPASVYARSKWNGERALVRGNAQHLIFRTSWIYDPKGKNFPRTILRLAKSKESLRVVSDQIGAPTSARAVARATAHVVRRYFKSLQSNFNEPFPFGVYNVACSGYCSWFEFATDVIELARKHGLNLVVKEIIPVRSSEYSVKAKRPLNSRLDLAKFESTFSYKMPHWRSELEELASGLCKADD